MCDYVYLGLARRVTCRSYLSSDAASWVRVAQEMHDMPKNQRQRSKGATGQTDWLARHSLRLLKHKGD